MTPLRGTDTTHRVTPPVNPRGINPAQASDILDRLLDLGVPRVIVDSATLIYNTAGVTSGDKAFAACMIAQSERTLGE